MTSRASFSSNDDNEPNVIEVEVASVLLKHDSVKEELGQIGVKPFLSLYGTVGLFGFLTEKIQEVSSLGRKELLKRAELIRPNAIKALKSVFQKHIKSEKAFIADSLISLASMEEDELALKLRKLSPANQTAIYEACNAIVNAVLDKDEEDEEVKVDEIRSKRKISALFEGNEDDFVDFALKSSKQSQKKVLKEIDRKVSKVSEVAKVANILDEEQPVLKAKKTSTRKSDVSRKKEVSRRGSKREEKYASVGRTGSKSPKV
jgi:hypothetical protein